MWVLWQWEWVMCAQSCSAAWAMVCVLWCSLSVTAEHLLLSPAALSCLVLFSRAGRGRRQPVRRRVESATGHLSASPWLSWPTDPAAWTAVSTWVCLLLGHTQLTQQGIQVPPWSHLNWGVMEVPCRHKVFWRGFCQLQPFNVEGSCGGGNLL